jgi:hypothetical protein
LKLRALKPMLANAGQEAGEGLIRLLVAALQPTPRPQSFGVPRVGIDKVRQAAV